MSHVNGKTEHVSQTVGKQETFEDPNNKDVGVTRATRRKCKTAVTKNRIFMVNNLQILTRFSKMTSFECANYKTSILNVNRKFVTTNFEFQVNNFQQQSINNTFYKNVCF
jgi:hypothetical protein